MYAVQGVEISSPYEDPAEANDTTHYEDAFNWCRFSDFDLLRHVVPLGYVDLTILGVSEEESLTTWEVEGLLDIVDIRGPHATANSYKICEGSSSAGFNCSVTFDFWGKNIVVESSSVSAGKILAAEKLDSLVQSEKILEGESVVAAQAICDSFEGRVVECSIDCELHYPYSSSLCTGSLEIEEIGELPFSTLIAALSLVLVLAIVMVTLIRGCLERGDFGSSRPRIEDHPVKFESSFTIPRRNGLSREIVSSARGGDSGSIPLESMDPGGEMRVVPLMSWPGYVAVLTGTGAVRSVRISGDSVVLASCFSDKRIVRNATVREFMAMLEPPQRTEFEAASRNANTLEWASAFSLYHCISCVWMFGVLTHVAVSSGWGAFYWLLALCTYACFSEETSLGTVVRAFRFRGRVLPYSTRDEGIVLPTLLGAAQLWYELELPYGSVVSWGIFILVTTTVTANATLVSFVYRSLPTADRAQRMTQSSWSVEHAMELCRASGSRFGMAGAWVERSRCGDIAGRTAFMTSLGMVEPDGKGRVGHVYKRSQMSWTAHERGGQPPDTYGNPPGDDENLYLIEEQMALSRPGDLVMVCAGLKDPA